MEDSPVQEMFGLGEMVGTIWLHKKTGHLYYVVDEAKWEEDLSEVVVYAPVLPVEGELGNATWARRRDIFLDGRFEYITRDHDNG